MKAMLRCVTRVGHCHVWFCAKRANRAFAFSGLNVSSAESVLGKL